MATIRDRDLLRELRREREAEDKILAFKDFLKKLFLKNEIGSSEPVRLDGKIARIRRSQPVPVREDGIVSIWQIRYPSPDADTVNQEVLLMSGASTSTPPEGMVSIGGLKSINGKDKLVTPLGEVRSLERLHLLIGLTAVALEGENLEGFESSGEPPVTPS